jgi:hypothetical protein
VGFPIEDKPMTDDPKDQRRRDHDHFTERGGCRNPARHAK